MSTVNKLDVVREPAPGSHGRMNAMRKVRHDGDGGLGPGSRRLYELDRASSDESGRAAAAAAVKAGSAAKAAAARRLSGLRPQRSRGTGGAAMSSTASCTA